MTEAKHKKRAKMLMALWFVLMCLSSIFATYYLAGQKIVIGSIPEHPRGYYIAVIVGVVLFLAHCFFA